MNRLLIRETRWPRDIPAAVRQFTGDNELAWLDSPLDVAPHLHGARYSLIAVRPCALLEQFEGGPARLCACYPDNPAEPDEPGKPAEPANWRLLAEASDVWRLWQRIHAALPRCETSPLPLGPGWVGYIGFEAARQLERLPATRRDDFGLPLIRLAFHERVIVLDHAEQRAWHITAPACRAALYSAEVGRTLPAARRGGRSTNEQGTAEFSKTPRFESDEDYLARWERAASATTHGYDSIAPSPPMHWARVMDQTPRAHHETAVRRALAYIAAGDIYQVNIAQRLQLTRIEAALPLYTRLRRANPAAYAALLRWSGGAVASVSPELFLNVRDGCVLTSPIKGTRPRTGDDPRDAAAIQDLLDSPKEAAELAMIVDLHRNDLGRVCEFGSVQVAATRRLESHPTVFHTVADVVGRLRPDKSPLDLLMAAFPAGSISGVPKIRALEIIDELEPCARGVYTGAIGWLGLDGQMTLNVAIRTLQIRGAAATLYAGGGIVADSDPAAEYEETLAKARGILGVLLAEPSAATPPPTAPSAIAEAAQNGARR